ncbi:MAG: phosphopyruvate hydratase [Candidatus Kapabacteria bacterium]|nr:phosphopyruvate hydratase [Candidatus Kapabacteria bacterium]MCS7170176.1 phosphopyruvate hydratase [Candidatus Kapabacteria bacterium]MDW7997184.1 phosphopyruvate hydratase [Bacteroidota bacterium]MDW8224775.1 phosphopyruvate hydratase [Bacteroidota bacterium]
MGKGRACIERVRAREVLDSRGCPTVEVEVLLAGGAWGRAAVPSGASTGKHEAVELRDGNHRYGGRGVRRALMNIHERIAPALRGMEATEQWAVDACLRELDGTPTKSVLGANAIVGVSLAVAKAAAAALDMPLFAYIGGTAARYLPVPLFNVLNGGRHAENALDVQEFLLIPHGAPTFAEALRAGAEVYDALRGLLRARGYSTAVGDEGGFAPTELRSHEEALELLVRAIERAGYVPGKEIAVGLDVAASGLVSDGVYVFSRSGRPPQTATELVAWYERLAADYPLTSLEDGLGEADWVGWRELTQRLGRYLQIVGDDLFVTNSELLRRGIAEGVANAILIKPNQVGTLSETIETVQLAHQAGYRTILSHRSGETEDVSIAHLAVGLGALQIKTGAPCRGERTAKYNELLRIEEEIGSRALFAGTLELFRPQVTQIQRSA